MEAPLILGLMNLRSEENLDSQESFSTLNNTRNPYSDNVIVSTKGMKDLVRTVSESPNIISSKFLTINSISGQQKRFSKDDLMVFISASFGAEDRLKEVLLSYRDSCVIETKGIYDYVFIRKRQSEDKSDFDARNITRPNPSGCVDYLNPKSLTDPNGFFDLKKEGLIRGSLSMQLGRDLDLSSTEVSIKDISGRNYIGNNRKELVYTNDPEINFSFFQGCTKISHDILDNIDDLSKAIIYAPLRGSKPITDIVLEQMRFLSGDKDLPNVVYPVTSSFVRYPVCLNMKSKNNHSHASGRYANILELHRLMPHLDGFTDLIYIDEIVSGGMLTGHCTEMVGERKIHTAEDINKGILDEGILRDLIENEGLRVHVYGLSDQDGKRVNRYNLDKLNGYVDKGLISFKSQPVANLITEDNRYLLGQHFTNFKRGPHAVPMINSGEYYPEYDTFIQDYLNWRDNVKWQKNTSIA